MTLFNIDRSWAIVVQSVEIKINGNYADIDSWDSVDVVYPGTDEVVLENIIFTRIGLGRYSASKSITSYTLKVGFYELLVRNAKFGNKTIKKFRTNLFRVSHAPLELAAEGESWNASATAKLYRRDINTAGLNSKVFSYRPKTFFYEESDYIYNNEANYNSYIPSGLDVYIFPARGVWSEDVVSPSLIDEYKANASVGVSVPASYLHTEHTHSGFSQIAFTQLSGLGSLQISSSGNLIYTDEAKAPYAIWNDTHRNTYINLINSYASGVDFVLYRGFEDFSYQLQMPNADPMLDYDTYGWYGNPPFSGIDWNTGLNKFIQSGTASDLFDNRQKWFPHYYSNLRRLEESPASVMIGEISQDTSWEEGELWNYINRVYDFDQPTFIATTYDRNATSLDAKLGKAIALMTDSYYSPGQANFELFRNYTASQYSNYNIGEPIGRPYKVGNVITRNFSNGRVEIDDDGTSIQEDNIRIFVETVSDDNVYLSQPDTFLTMMYKNDQLYDDLTTQELEDLSVVDYWAIESEAAFNDTENANLLKEWLEVYNEDIAVGATLYYTNWPQTRWAAEYTSGLSTMGANFYPRLSGVAYDSVNYRIFWYDYINATDLEFYILEETDTNFPIAHVAWLTTAFPTKQIIFKTSRTDFPHTHLMISGIDNSNAAYLKAAGSYIWLDDESIASNNGLGLIIYSGVQS